MPINRLGEKRVRKRPKKRVLQKLQFSEQNKKILFVAYAFASTPPGHQK